MLVYFFSDVDGWYAHVPITITVHFQSKHPPDPTEQPTGCQQPEQQPIQRFEQLCSSGCGV